MSFEQIRYVDLNKDTWRGQRPGRSVVSVRLTAVKPRDSRMRSPHLGNVHKAVGCHRFRARREGFIARCTSFGIWFLTFMSLDLDFRIVSQKSSSAMNEFADGGPGGI